MSDKEQATCSVEGLDTLFKELKKKRVKQSQIAEVAGMTITTVQNYRGTGDKNKLYPKNIPFLLVLAIAELGGWSLDEVAATLYPGRAEFLELESPDTSVRDGIALIERGVAIVKRSVG